MQWLKLIGILIIIIGFVLKFDTIATVVIAGLVTALVSGIDFMQFLDMLGSAFVDQRVVSIFFLTLPMVGLAESYGLKQRAVALIEKMQGLTMHAFLSTYLVIREAAGLFAIRLGGHPQFVRPLVYPMAEAAAKAKYGDLSENDVERIKALSAANENFGNFYAQNTFMGASGVLLVNGTLQELGYDAPLASIAKASLPVAGAALVLGVAYNYYVEKQIARHKNNSIGGERK